MKRLLFILVLCATRLVAQNGNTQTIIFNGVPTGTCSPVALAVNKLTGDEYNCFLGAWNKISASGAGTTINATDNTLPKRSNATTFVDSLWRDDGTTIAGIDGIFGGDPDGYFTYTSIKKILTNPDATTDFTRSFRTQLQVTSTVDRPGSDWVSIYGRSVVPAGQTFTFGGLVGAYISAEQSGTGNGDGLVGVRGDANIFGGGTQTQMDGVQGIVNLTSTGNVTNRASGFRAHVVASTNQTVPETDGLFVDSMSKNGGVGTITNNYGIYINDQTAGATNYALKTGLGQVSFGDTVTGSSTINAQTGFKVANAAPNGKILIGNGTNYVGADPQMSGPDAQAAAQAQGPVMQGGRYYTDGTVRTFATDNVGNQQMGIVGTVTLGNLPQQPFLNTTDFTDVVAGSPALGDTLYANSTPKWTKLAAATTSGGGSFINQTQGFLAVPSAPTLTVNNTGGTIQNNYNFTVYVIVTLVNAFGETTGSAESSVAMNNANGCLTASTTCSLTVTAPTLTGNATGYTVYSGRDINFNEKQQLLTANCVNITINCVIGALALGTGTNVPTYNTAANGTAVIPAWKGSTGTGNVVLAANATLVAKSINLTLYPENFTGADMCAQIAQAWIALPTTGGKIDATGFQGAQNCATDPFDSADLNNKPLDLALGVVTINSTTAWNLPSNFHTHGIGDMTVIAFQPAGGASETTKADLFHCNGCSNIELDHIKFTGTANTGRLLSLAQGSNYRIHHNTISGATYIPVAGPATAIYIEGASDVWIENNVLTGNGPGPASSTTSTNADIITWTATVQNRVHIRNNQISGSHMDVAIALYDCLDCDVIGNSIDQNNTITTTLTHGGYGIQVYGVNQRPRNVRIEANHVFNAAGTCIYLASNDHAVVVGNDVQTCGQQETDGSIPVAGIAANDCGNCLIDGNSIKTSTKDGIDLVAPSLGTVISNNTIQTITQYGMWSRTATDASWINNTVQTSTLDWFRDTGSRNLVALNHVLTSGAATTVATDYLLGNCIDATGCAYTFDAPANKTGQADIVADSAAINTTETIIVKTPALVASRLVAGSHIRITLTGTCTSTVANTSTFTLRWGTNGTTADGTVAALVSSVAAASGTNNGFRAVIDLTVRVAGASATSSAFMELLSDGNIGIVATPNEKFVAGTAFNTTTANAILSLAYKSAATTTTSTFKNATIEVVYQ